MTSTNSTYRAQSQKIKGPSGFINSLCFSIGGRYLACASDDHLLTVYDCKNNPKTIWQHKGSTAYTGEIMTFTPIQFLVKIRLVKAVPTLIHEFVAPVSFISLNRSGNKMLVCAGEMVNVLKCDKNDWILKARLSCPCVMLKPRGFQEPAIIATGAHFLEDESSCVVAYLHHGLWKYEVETGEGIWCWGPDEKIGATSISPDFSALVTANIRSGLDWYRLPTTRQISKVSTSLEVQDKNANFPLPVQFINKGKTRITALAYADRDNRPSFVATADFTPGGGTVVRVWAQEGKPGRFAFDLSEVLKVAVGVYPSGSSANLI
ncbi:hypothetical protein BT96DRAFT_1008439 [Gymnopus androsaceus JB14]|uniref:WD40 repeat-like protein n=1 Tax=Gymnopus androsaceus JB14 TaxID=1447944 RepID=A0A6A4GEV1_9AGAR|nr:hypothetical protein BT96DRAFT_1008439 [Gymnopus androsaceus JB14]